MRATAMGLIALTLSLVSMNLHADVESARADGIAYLVRAGCNAEQAPAARKSTEVSWRMY